MITRPSVKPEGGRTKFPALKRGARKVLPWAWLEGGAKSIGP